MKQAYLIIAHNKIEQLKFLLSLLDYEKHDIFILFDQKAMISNIYKNELKQVAKKSNIFFTKEIPIYWGDYSLVEAELELFEAASKQDNYSMYHLISGVDLPLDTAENIFNFFDKNRNYSFINISPNEIFMKNKADERIKFYYFNVKRINVRSTNSKFFKFLFRLYRKIEKMIQIVLGINRINDIKVSYGSNWCSLNNKSVEVLLSNKDFIERTFSFGYLVDELVVHTTLATFDSLDNLYHYDSSDDFQGNLRYINWWDGNPYTWTDSPHDIEQLKYGKKQGHLFSRKFDLEMYPGMEEKIKTIINMNCE